MNLKELETIMISYGIALRAIPREITEIYEQNHSNKYTNGEIRYLADFKREMLIVRRVPKNAGKFIAEIKVGSGSSVLFNSKKVYDSIEQAIKDISGGDETKPQKINL